MKIYYFSGTGNTLYLAKKIQDKIPCQLIDISKIYQNKNILEGEIGILFPTYAMGIPRIVEIFLKNIKVQNISYFFALGTCGGSGYGIPFKQIDNILSKKNLTIDYSEFIHMPDNYIKLFTPMNKEAAEVDILNSNNRINGIITNIQNKKHSKYKSSFVLYILFSTIYKFWRNSLKKNYKNFKVTKDCISCNICKEVCPTQNIQMKDNKPFWHSNCEECLACINLCPKIAIFYGKKSKNKLRYMNPFILINELKK